MAYVDRRSPESWRVLELSDQLCACGCGRRTFVSPKTKRSKGWVRGEPRRFRYGHHSTPGRDYVNTRWGALPDAGERQYTVPIGPRRLCACGCGALADGLGRWVRGHGRRKRIRWVVDENGCWVWQLNVDVHGYGRVTVGGEKLKAHRVAFEEAHGPIPAGHDVHHDCENKRCVNPAHLRALTPDAHGQLHGEQWRRAA